MGFWYHGSHSILLSLAPYDTSETICYEYTHVATRTFFSEAEVNFGRYIESSTWEASDEEVYVRSEVMNCLVVRCQLTLEMIFDELTTLSYLAANNDSLVICCDERHQHCALTEWRGI